MADEETNDPSQPKAAPKPVYVGGESLADRILPHLKKIIVSIIVIAVILSVFFGIRAWKQGKQADETMKLAKVMQLAQRPIAPPPAPGAPKSTEETFADAKARATAVLAEAAKQGVDLPASLEAGLLLDKGDVDAAIAEYRRGTTATGIDGVLAREGLGIALEGKAMAEKDPAARQKLLEEALAAFVAMQPKQDGPRRGYALYHQGRVQQVLGKSAEAKTLYEQAKTAGAASPELVALVDKRLASLGAS